MAHTAADGSKWSNAAQARRVPVPGRSIGDGKQPVSRFSKPEAPRAATAEPVAAHQSAEDQTQDPSQVVLEHGPANHLEINHQEGHKVSSKHPDGHEHHSAHGSAEEAHTAAGTLAGVGAGRDDMQPSQAMM
jgi:hypothetical protein